MTLLVLMIFIPIGINFYLFSNNLMFGLISTVLSLYIIYLVTNIIEYTVANRLKIVKVRRLVIYPFVYERRVTFKPVKLLYNRECIQDVMPQNIVYEYNMKNPCDMYNKYKRIRFIRELSMFVGYLIASIIVIVNGNVDAWIAYALSFVSSYLISYMQVGTVWKGNKRIIKNNNIKRDILAGNYNHCIHVNEYCKYLNDVMIENENIFDLIFIVENYLYTAILYDDLVLSVKRLGEIVKFLQGNKKLYSKEYDRLIVLIGLAGKMNTNADYVNLAISFLGNDINSDYYDFLLGKLGRIDIKNFITINKHDIFISKRLIEMRIDAFCGYIIKQDN